MLIRASLFVFLSFLIVGGIKLAFVSKASHDVMDGMQAKLIERDVDTIRIVVDMWYASNYHRDFNDYSTNSYEEFKKKMIEETQYMPVDLPPGKNFAEFSFSGTRDGFEIKIKAKDENGTMIYATPEKIWSETG
jgi:hypothetical protein